MKLVFSIIFTLFLFLSLISCQESQSKEKVNEESTKPNIIYILADDLGYGDLGAYGQEKIETPNIDALAREGMLFTQHYSSFPVCAPARYSLLTGKHAGHAYIRGNNEWTSRGDVWNYRKVEKDSTLEGQYPTPKGTITIAKKLQNIGYQTGMMGKWGMGAPHTHSIPTKMGFDYFYGYNCQRQAHTYYPLHLYKNENRVHLNNDTVAPSQRLPKSADPYELASYDKFRLNEYSPSLMFEQVINFVKTNKDQSFFLYWASPIPHAPLQAPKRWIDYYVEKFGDEEPYIGDESYFPSRYPHATYAAMVSYLDENVGKLIDQLKKEGIYENTLIIFSSDNGPTFNGGTDSPWFDSAAPFRSDRGRAKGFLYEGGIRVPMIASWPGHIEANTKTDLISVQYDVMATLAELTGYKAPKDTDGISFLPTLLGNTDEQEHHDFLYWEYPGYGGQVAIRMGDWKVVRQNLKNKEKATLELYNLKNDPTESENVAKEHPEIIKRAATIFKEEHTDTGVERFSIPAIEDGKELLGDEI